MTKPVAPLAIIALALLALACAEEAPVQPTSAPAQAAAVVTPTAMPEPTDNREALLEEAAETFAKAFEDREWATLYALQHKEYREKCAFGEFVGMMFFAVAFIGLSEDTTVTVISMRIEGDEAWVDMLWEQDGVELDFGDDNANPAFVWQDGRWWGYVSPEEMAKENLCDLSTLSTNETPAPIPTFAPIPTRAAPFIRPTATRVTIVTLLPSATPVPPTPTPEPTATPVPPTATPVPPTPTATPVPKLSLPLGCMRLAWTFSPASTRA